MLDEDDDLEVVNTSGYTEFEQDSLRPYIKIVKSETNIEPDTVIARFSQNSFSSVYVGVNNFKGNMLGSIRKYTHSKAYSGPTRFGISGDKDFWIEILAKLEDYTPTENKGSMIIHTIKKSQFTEYHVYESHFKDRTILTFSKVNTKNYNGYGKGASISVENLSELIRSIKDMITKL